MWGGKAISHFFDRWWIVEGEKVIGKGELRKNIINLVKKTFKEEFITCWVNGWNTHKPNDPLNNQGCWNLFQVLTLAGHYETKTLQL